MSDLHLEQQRRLQDILDGTGAGTWDWDMQTGELQVNAQWAAILGRSLPDLTPVTYDLWKSLVHPDDVARTEAAVAEHQAGRTLRYDCEFRMRHQKGHWIWVHSSGQIKSWNADGTARKMFGTYLDVTERQLARQQLIEAESAQRRQYEATPAMLYSISAQGNFLAVSNQFAQWLGYGREAMLGQKPTRFMTPESAQYALHTVFPEFLRSGAIRDVAYQFVGSNGEVMDVLVSAVLEHDAEGRPVRSLSTVTDVTERLRIGRELEQERRQLANSEAHLRSVINTVPAMIAYIDAAQRYVYVNHQYQTRFAPGCPELIGLQVQEVLGPELYAVARPHIEAVLLGQPQSYETQSFPGVWLHVNYLPHMDDAGAVSGYYVLGTNITQIKAHEAELDRVTNFDSLTHLPNRRLLSDRLQQALLRSDRSGRATAICFLDLDGFKAINDQLGHAVGDQVLLGVAQHLGTVLRADDTLARLGGDEFVLLLSDLASTSECTQILERVLEVCRRPVQAEGSTLSVSASIGVSLYPSDRSDPDILLRHADMAMYLAKQAGKNRYQLFDTEIDRMAQCHRDYLEQMELALQRQEFVLYYQPQVSLVTGQVVGAEALARWQHPLLGLLAPGEFLPHLNGSHLEARFGEWVIASALQQLREWQALGLELKVSVNISANHLLQSDFCERLALALSAYPDVAAAQLELEVLETAAIGDMQQAVDVLHACMGLGVRFALDDFGTGYSSLTYLRKLPVHTLKIDQSFVRDMLSDPDDLGIVRGIIELAHVFNRQVVAEGVETMEHGAALQQLGCRLAQGYGIARPMPAAQLPAWCVDWQCRPGF
jgi:diguanylate cyclase (GGDEF)-like protein/PAS domain S-box-containing protein